MKVIVAGGTGFLGRPLAQALTAAGHDVVVLTRAQATTGPPSRLRYVTWNPDSGSAGPWLSELDDAGAVVNLAGESIAARRWSSRQKQQILDSRINATRALVDAVRRIGRGTFTLINASAVGYYGPLGDEHVTEDHSAGSDFLAGVCVAWESEAGGAASAARVVCVRSGLILHRDGGALPPMLLPFKLGAGGPLGSGRQYWPWIHRDDWLALVSWLIETSSVSGPVNATAPNPVTNADFARALGRALRRPAFMPAPGFALRSILGEMADALLLSGQRAIPEKAERLGFRFRYRELGDALGDLFPRKS